MNIIKHTASSLFWSYCFHSTLSLSRSLFVCCCCCCWAAAPSVIFLFESYGKTTEPAIYRIHLWWRHAANSSSPLSTSPISFMRICASIRLAHFVASTLFALCVSLSLMFTLAAPGAFMESLCRNEIFVEHCERKGYHRIFVCINTFCKCKHDQYTTVRRALIPNSMCGDWRRAIPSFHRTIALWYWAYFTRFPLFCFVRCIFFHFFISEWITISTANINDTNWAWADERLEIHINSPDSVVRCGMAGSALHAVFLCTHRNLLVFGVSHTFTCSSVGTPFWIDRIKVGCACCRPFAMRIK